jgi:succinate dehydrogenase / fumarate reductase iron-sulfur subunit
MSNNDLQRTVTVRIQRFNPEVDKKPYMQDFQVEMKPGMTILDALHEIKTHQDGSVTYRRSCRHGICGSCAMHINGRNTLACKTPLVNEVKKNDTVTIGPLPYLPIIKDMVVDRTSFWEQYLRVKPWLLPPEDIPEKEFRMSQEEVDALHDAEACIMCGACYSSCAVIGLNKQYLGPHALLKAFLRVLDPRDTEPAERLEIVSQADGVARCHNVFNCIDACPKGLNPTQAIETLRKLAQKRQKYEEARRERQKHLNEPIPS